MLLKLQNAYDTISDPEKRRVYDVRWASIRDSLRAQQESERRQAEAAETERKRATEERAKNQREEAARQERLRPLELLKFKYDSDIFEINRVVRKLNRDLKRLQDQDDGDLRKERERNSWWAYLASPIYGKLKDTDEQKQKRETERLHRHASKSIKVSELHTKEAKLQGLQDALKGVNSQIAAEKMRAEDEVRAQARERVLRMQQEAGSRAQQEIREQWAKNQKDFAERVAKQAREAQAAREAREAREAQERMRQAAAAQQRKRVMRAAEEAAQRARNDRSKSTTPSYSSFRSSGSTKSTCRHDKFWPRVEGRHCCSNCHTVQRRFAFQCPRCSIIACANCRQALRREVPKSHNAGQRFSVDSENNYDAGFSYCEDDW